VIKAVGEPLGIHAPQFQILLQTRGMRIRRRRLQLLIGRITEELQEHGVFQPLRGDGVLRFQRSNVSPPRRHEIPRKAGSGRRREGFDHQGLIRRAKPSISRVVVAPRRRGRDERGHCIQFGTARRAGEHFIHQHRIAFRGQRRHRQKEARGARGIDLHRPLARHYQGAKHGIRAAPPGPHRIHRMDRGLNGEG
jgi:hypothetical protein